MRLILLISLVYLLEAGNGIEPMSTALQAVAFPYISMSYKQCHLSCHPRLTVGRQNSSKREQLCTLSALMQTVCLCYYVDFTFLTFVYTMRTLGYCVSLFTFQAVSGVFNVTKSVSNTAGPICYSHKTDLRNGSKYHYH